MATVAPITVDESTFESEVLNAEKPVLVDFWAAWVRPCRLVSPVVESIGDKHARQDQRREGQHRRQPAGDALQHLQHPHPHPLRERP